MMGHGCGYFCRGAAGARVAFEFGDVHAIDGAVMHRALRDFAFATHRRHRWRSNRQARGVSAGSSRHRHCAAFFDVVDDGFGQREFASGSFVGDFVAGLDDVRCGDAAAILQHDGVRGSRGGRHEQCQGHHHATKCV